ncbi:hypothetical protein GQ44DRAFT_711282 [Phaeosphaeriaceae sp. PMI808]|nr:hypothetical protein GQ44DRAFT_711282 [Phaeosphaeriaceae sp. PMI808]
MLSKKMRTMTMPVTQDRMTLRAATSTPPDMSITGSDNRCPIQGSIFKEIVTPSPEPSKSTIALTSPTTSRRQTNPKHLPPLPTTPVRPAPRKFSLPQSDPSPTMTETPIYARSMHLIDTDNLSIYQKVHGNDDYVTNPLCKDCFRHRGTFKIIHVKHGYEACGADEPLQSHYWEEHGDRERM